MHSFSIIVPTFNSASFVERAMLSILNQNNNNYEVICVDDGSDDATPEKIAEIIHGDPKFRIIKSQHIGKASAMRNKGLEIAKNDYIIFLDADDELETNALENFSKIIEKENAPDIILGRASTGFIEKGNFKKESEIGNFTEFKTFKSGRDVLSYFAVTKKNLSCYGCINAYKRTLLLENQLFQSERILFLEDHEWLPRTLFVAKKTTTNPTPFYRYIRHDSSITTSLSKNSLLDLLAVCSSIAKFIDKNSSEIDFQLKHFFSNHALNAFYWFFFAPIYMGKIPDSTRKEILRDFFANKTHRKEFTALSMSATRIKRLLFVFVYPFRWNLFAPSSFFIRKFYIKKISERLQKKHV